MTVFAPDPKMLRTLWLMLAGDGQFLRVSWSPGAGLAPVDGPDVTSEERLVQRLVAELDAEELFARAAPALVDEDGQELAPAEPVLVSYDFAPDDIDGWLWMVQRMSEDREVQLSVGHRRRRGFGIAEQASVLWARVESQKDAKALARFRPRPTLVLREGSTCRRVALWSLRRPLSYEWLVRGNKRIAHKLFAPKKWCEPEFVFPAPGSCLRVGRSRPVPVRVEAFDPGAVYTAREVVGRLKDAPNPNAWREAA